MEARGAVAGTSLERVSPWLLGLVPLLLIAAAIGAFALLGGPGLGGRTGPPVEDLAVERTVLHPGTIELTVRNDGPDPVEIAQVAVNDGYVSFTATDGTRLGRLGSTTLDIAYPWIEGEAYTIFLLTSTGGTIEHEIPVAAETPETDTSFFGLMALLGVYVGVHVIEGYLVQPIVMRRAVEANPALLLFFQALMGALFGLLGLIVATPLLTVLQITVTTLWIEGRLHKKSPTEKPPAPEPSEPVAAVH